MSSSSYINWQLPDMFIQCQPALISFEAVFDARDEDALGGSLRNAISSTWINLHIKPSTGDVRARGISVDLPSNATSWRWASVKLPGGTNFEVLITALSNIPINSHATTGKDGTSSPYKTPPQSLPYRLAAASAAGGGKTDKNMLPVVIARAFARFNVVTSETNDARCLGAVTATNGTHSVQSFGYARGGSLAGPGQQRTPRVATPMPGRPATAPSSSSPLFSAVSAAFLCPWSALWRGTSARTSRD